MATEADEIRGIGHSVKRKEDDRFIRGRGTYIDDITCPGCCTWRSCGARSPTRRSTGIDTSRRPRPSPA